MVHRALRTMKLMMTVDFFAFQTPILIYMSLALGPCFLREMPEGLLVVDAPLMVVCLLRLDPALLCGSA